MRARSGGAPDKSGVHLEELAARDDEAANAWPYCPEIFGADAGNPGVDQRQMHARAALLAFVIVGAGPTGVELVGTIAELARETLSPDFRNIDTQMTRVVLIEAGPRVLAGYPDSLSQYAHRSLETLGVEVELGRAVSECTPDGVV